MFNLLASIGQIELTSERSVSRSGATNGIESVKLNAADDGKSELSASGTRFNLKAGKGQFTGTGQTCSSEAAAREGMQAVERAAADATVDDRTYGPVHLPVPDWSYHRFGSEG